jgi:hypothetical protein
MQRAVVSKADARRRIRRQLVAPPWWPLLMGGGSRAVVSITQSDRPLPASVAKELGLTGAVRHDVPVMAVT